MRDDLFVKSHIALKEFPWLRQYLKRDISVKIVRLGTDILECTSHFGEYGEHVWIYRILDGWGQELMCVGKNPAKRRWYEMLNTEGKLTWPLTMFRWLDNKETVAEALSHLRLRDPETAGRARFILLTHNSEPSELYVTRQGHGVIEWLDRLVAEETARAEQSLEEVLSE